MLNYVTYLGKYNNCNLVLKGSFLTFVILFFLLFFFSYLIVLKNSIKSCMHTSQCPSYMSLQERREVLEEMQIF